MADLLNRGLSQDGPQGHYVEVLRAVRGGDAGWFQGSNAVLFGLLGFSVLLSFAFVHYPTLYSVPTEGPGEWLSDQWNFL